MTTTAAPNRGPVKVLVAVTFIAMITMNVLANALPLNGRNTGEVSNSYSSLFTPAGVTFAIWSLIYLLLGAHVLYQLGLFRDGPETPAQSALLNRVGVLFSISSLAVLTTVILVCLALISITLRNANLVGRQRWLVGLPFSVYFGWATVATVANITVLLVKWKWDGFGLPESTWAVIIVGVATAIGTATMLRNRDVAYGLVLIWAFGGILLRQVSSSGLDGRYPQVITAVVASLVIFVIAEALVLRQRRSAATPA